MGDTELRELLPIQLWGDRDSCVQDEQFIFSVAGGSRMLVPALQSVRDLLHFHHLHDFFSPCRRKEELSHSAPWELRPWIQQLIFVCSAVWLTLCPTLSQAVEWNRNQRNFFSFLQLWHDSEECPTIHEINVFQLPPPTRSLFLVQACIVFQNLIWISLPTHIWFWPVLPFSAL